MELWTDVVVKRDAKLSGVSLKGLRGRIVDYRGPNCPQLPKNLRFVRFPPVGRTEFFAWIKIEDLRALETA